METTKWTALLVDDERELALTLAERLELRGIAARVAFDGESALAAMAKDEPQVMVLDLLMPGMKGIDVLQAVRRDFPKVKVILVTGQGQGHEGEEGVRLGAFCFMTKPIDLPELVEVMEKAMAQAAA